METKHSTFYALLTTTGWGGSRILV